MDCGNGAFRFFGEGGLGGESLVDTKVNEDSGGTEAPFRRQESTGKGARGEVRTLQQIGDEFEAPGKGESNVSHGPRELGSLLGCGVDVPLVEGSHVINIGAGFGRGESGLNLLPPTIRS